MATTRQTADWLTREIRERNPHKGQPSNIQLAWTTGYLLGLLASLINEDTHVARRVIEHLDDNTQR